MSAPAFDWLTTIGVALTAAFRRASSRADRLRYLDALDEVARLAGASA